MAFWAAASLQVLDSDVASVAGVYWAFAHVGAAQRRNNKSCQENELAARKVLASGDPRRRLSDPGDDEEVEKHKLATTQQTRTGRSPRPSGST